MTRRYKELNFKMGTCSPADIRIEERARVELGDLDSLKEAIDMVGIINPITVKKLPEGSTCPYEIIAGMRRLYCAIQQGLPTVPIRIYPSDLDKETQLTIEMLENVARKPFEWDEQVRLESQIHSLQQEKHGKKTSTKKDGPGWSQADTAKLLGRSASGMSESMQLAELLKTIPELKGCKTINEAKKVLKKIQNNERMKAMSVKLQSDKATTGVDGSRNKLASSYVLGDALVQIPLLDDAFFDVVEIDPPYGIDYKNVVKQAATTLDYNEIPEDEYTTFITNTIKAVYPKMKDNSWLILWHDASKASTLVDILRDIGLTVRGIPAMWFKEGSGGFTNQPTYLLPSVHEPFLYARKGKPCIKKQGRSDVYSYKSLPASKRIHPTERPIPMMIDILSTFAEPGMSCLVPFAGSGAALAAAHAMDMTAVGFDLSTAYKDAFTVRALEGFYDRKATQSKEKKHAKKV